MDDIVLKRYCFARECYKVKKVVTRLKKCSFAEFEIKLYSRIFRVGSDKV